MNTYDKLLAYVEEIAARNVAIGHDQSPTASREARRFFQWGNNDGELQAGYALNNTGWNLLFDAVDGSNVDNRHDYEANNFRIALHFVRNVAQQDIPAANATVTAAYDLGWKVLRRMRKHAQNPCKAVTDGEISVQDIVPKVIEWPTIKYQPLAPLLFVGDNHYGFRFELVVKYDVPNIITEDNADWRTV